MSERTIPEWTKVGAKLITYNSSSWGVSYGPVVTIAKVFKNGNFKIEGRDEQYRSFKDEGRRAGGDSYGRGPSYKPLTPEVEAAAARERLVDKARDVVRAEGDRLVKMARSSEEDEILAAADSIGRL